MGERAAELSALADRLPEREGVRDAWTAKSFTDRLFVVEIPEAGSLSEDLRWTLHEHDLREANEVYEVDGVEDADYAGDLSDGRRYRFVDVQSRGEMQSYVVE
ncbi:hypothetical protein [Halosimplex sp. J119]